MYVRYCPQIRGSQADPAEDDGPSVPLRLSHGGEPEHDGSQRRELLCLSRFWDGRRRGLLRLGAPPPNRFHARQLIQNHVREMDRADAAIGDEPVNDWAKDDGFGAKPLPQLSECWRNRRCRNGVDNLASEVVGSVKVDRRRRLCWCWIDILRTESGRRARERGDCAHTVVSDFNPSDLDLVCQQLSNFAGELLDRGAEFSAEFGSIEHCRVSIIQGERDASHRLRSRLPLSA